MQQCIELNVTNRSRAYPNGREKEVKDIDKSLFGFEGTVKEISEIILDSSMVEHSAVNRVVVGSSPTRGVREEYPKHKAPWSSG